jgi:mycothiol system anti-sigma-R factor
MADAEDKDEVDCRAVVEELYTLLDGELTAIRRVQIERHYSGCPDCHEVVAFHSELKLVIAEKCRDTVPESLRLRIANALGLEPGIPGH